jgi:hypothetical protein
MDINQAAPLDINQAAPPPRQFANNRRAILAAGTVHDSLKNCPLERSNLSPRLARLEGGATGGTFT